MSASMTASAWCTSSSSRFIRLATRCMYLLLVLDSTYIAFSALALLFDETVGRISRDITVFSLVDLLVPPPAAGLATSAARSAALLVCARVFRDGALLSAAS